MNSILLHNLNSGVHYSFNDLKDMLDIMFKDVEIIRTNKKINYINMPVAFDIETSSFSEYSEKQAIMYEWTLGINGYCFIGRKWNEFIDTVNILVEYLGCNIENRLIVYVHNLSYEFQFMRKWFSWYKVFSIDTRKPIYAITNSGIEFRCSYLLSGYSLEKLGNNLTTYKVRKLTGYLDYSLLRHSRTILNDKEISYCVNDVMVVMAYIQERIENDGNISLIPLTKTGYVRKYCKSACLGRGKKRNQRYKKMIKSLTLEPDEYLQLKRAFQGGFTHANSFHSGKLLENVASYDFTSSYPTVMVSEQFPMMKSEKVVINSIDEFKTNLMLYCCLFDCEFTGLKSVMHFEHYISLSRCWSVCNATVDNGRIVSADRIRITLTEQDFLIINNFYVWDSMNIANFRRYKRAYLPTPFVKSILELYKNKTMLKGVSGEEYEYMRSKEMLNSCYGMCVTDICRDEVIYSDDWDLEKVDIEKSIDKYNKSNGRFLFYPWGVWVTAYARKNLFTGIIEAGEDYVYSDTDSLKMINKDKHLEYIDTYNNYIQEKIFHALNWHGLDYDMALPETIKGNIKPLGVWDYEGEYTRFKTLGAKRYMYEDDEGYHLTVAGLSKNDAMQYLIETFDNPFEGFKDGLYVPKGHTGKSIHTYLDGLQEGYIKDYNGEIESYHELSSVHLDDADYSLSLSEEYARFLLSITDKEF